MPSDNGEIQKRLEELKHYYGLEYEMVRATAAFEHAVLRPLFLLNGGALVAYLALFGALSRGSSHDVNLCTGSIAIILWSVGLLLAVVTAYFGYLSQREFRHHRGQQALAAEIRLEMKKGSADDADKESEVSSIRGQHHRGVAVVVGALSLIAFASAFWPAIASIR